MKRYILYIASVIVTCLFVNIAWGQTYISGDWAAGNLNSGTYILEENTYVTSTINIPNGKTVILDLNGYVLCGKNVETVIDVKGGGTLTIKDSNTDLGHAGKLNDKGIFIWGSSGATMTVTGGIIVNPYKNDATERKGIFVSGTCTIEHAKIMGCYTTDIGAAVTISSSGTFIMKGGEIRYNYTIKRQTAETSGAIYGEPSHSNNGSIIDISNTIISDNISHGDGGAICAFNVTLSNCNIERNYAGGRGGAMFIRHSDSGGNLSINNCKISSNTSATQGGAIHVNSLLPVSITNNSEISNNTAGTDGGGIYCIADIDISDSEIQNNTTVSNGGGIYCSGKTDITDSKIKFNSATYGGGLYTTGVCEILRTHIDTNYAKISGGGIESRANTTITSSTITGNRAMETETGAGTNGNGIVNHGRGGGFNFVGANSVNSENEARVFILDNTLVTYNATMYYGGGGQMQNKAKVVLQNNTKINNNTCVLKGAAGLHVTGGGFFYMNNTCEISNNVALGGVGGAIHSSYECSLHLDGGTINNNTVYGRGGGVHVNTGGDIVLNGTNITNNKAYDGYNLVACEIEKRADNQWYWSTPVSDGTNEKSLGYGGGVLVNSGSCTMNGGELSGNHAQSLGGGIAMIMAESGSYAHHVRLANFTLNAGSVTNNTTDGNGAGVYLMENILTYLDDSEKSKYTYLVESGDWTPKIILNGGSITNNRAGVNGGGAYQEQQTQFIVNAGKTVAISGNTAVESGGAVYIAKGSFIVNGTANITANKATNSEGGAIYLGKGTNANPSLFTVGANGSLNLGGVNSIDGNSAGANGGGIYCGGTFTVNGNTNIKYNYAVNGGAVYVDGASLTTKGKANIENNFASTNGGAFYVQGGNVSMANPVIKNNGKSGNNVTTNGGAIYVTGTGAGFTATGTAVIESNSASGFGGAIFVDGGGVQMASSEITSNSAANGGAIYLSGGNITTTGNSTISNNTASANGGAFFVSTGNIFTRGGSISNNAADGDGGVFYVNEGNIYLGTNANNNVHDEISLLNNKALNGGAIALYNGVFSLSKNCLISKNTSSNFGGGLYIKNTSNTGKVMSFTGGTFTENTAKTGGAVCADGDITLTLASTMENNKATDGVGGGLYITNGVKMTFGDGLIRANQAIGAPVPDSETGTAKEKDAKSDNNPNGVTGVGGGIFIGTNSTLAFSSQEMGIYNNFATNAGADLCANGSGTIITLPNISAMNLKGFRVPGNALYWVEDYFARESYTGYDGNSKTGIRYETALLTPSVDIAPFIINFTSNDSKEFKNHYLCIDLGYDLVFVTITVNGLEQNDDAAIIMSYPQNTETKVGDNSTYSTELIQYRKVLFSGNQTRIVGIPSGDWKFDITGWSYKYNDNPTFTPGHTVSNTVNTSDLTKYINIKRDGINGKTDKVTTIAVEFTKDVTSKVNKIQEHQYRLVNRMKLD